MRAVRNWNESLPARLLLVAMLGALTVMPVVADDPQTETVSETAEAPEDMEVVVETDSVGGEVEAPPPPQPAPPATPILPSPVMPIGPGEASFEAARALREEIAGFTSEKRSDLDTAGERRKAMEEELQDLANQLDKTVAGTKEADAYHAQIVQRLTAARRQLKDALDTLGAPTAAPSTDAIDGILATGLGDTGQEWGTLTAEIRQARQDAMAIEAEARWAGVALAGDTLQFLTAIRSVSFDRQSLDRRNVLLGTGKEGLEQLTRELSHLYLTTRYYVAARRHIIVVAPEAAGDLFAIGGAMVTLLELAIVIAIGLFIRSRWREWVSGVGNPLFRSTRTVVGRRRIERLLGFFEIAGPWLVMFATLYFVDWALGDWTKAFEIELILTLLYYYAAYRLAIDLVVSGTLRLSTRYELKISSERKALIQASVVLFFRVVFGLAVFVLVSNRLLGGGYLDQIADQFAGSIVAATLLYLMLNWRRELADAFLSKHPDGRIADLVRRTRDSWLGVFVAPASFLWILGRALAVLARDFALGFEQTQRALAFLFRRRIEKEAERRGYAAGDLENLPTEVAEVFSEEAISGGPELLDHFPGIDRLQKSISDAIGRGIGGAFLLTGERGTGKTSWLLQIQRNDVPVKRIELGCRVKTKDQLFERLAELLGVERVSAEAIVEHLGSGTPRIIILDNAQHLFLATVGGYDAWAAFTEVVSRTRHRVYWICAMSAYAWKHLKAVRTDLGVFGDHEHLVCWNEERIRELLAARITASGCYFNYSSLVLDGMEGVSSREHLIESAEGYARLLWDYADGNPRVAIHYFLRSLDRESDRRLRVRLFRAPEIERLESVGETALFILSCIVTHESISQADVAEATRYSDETVKIYLDRLVYDGVVFAANGLHRITTHWHRAAVRTLKRRNLLTV